MSGLAIKFKTYKISAIDEYVNKNKLGKIIAKYRKVPKFNVSALQGEDFNAIILTAEIKNNIIGMVRFSKLTGLSPVKYFSSPITFKILTQGDPAYYINMVYIDEKHRGKGYGRMLIDKLISLVDSKIFVLEVDPNNIPAVNLYKKCGFVFKDKELMIKKE